MFDHISTTATTLPPHPTATSINEETLIELANPSSPSASSGSANKSSPTNLNDNKDPAMKAGLPIELMEPVRRANIDNIDILLDMGNMYPSEVISNQKVLSPKKATYTTNSGSNTNNNNNKRDAFDDLLESFRTNSPQTNGFNGHSNHIVSDCTYDGFGVDPKDKINEWKENRRGNIRALLSSLHLVLSDDFKWKAIGMHQLVSDSDVKKIYRLACLAIHPDKVASADEDTKDIARMIFMELNEAWSKFEGK